MARERAMMIEGIGSSSTVSVTQLHEIDPTLLQDPVRKGSEPEVFIGRGSFGVVKLQVFRQMNVAVKEMSPRTVLSDVLNEARILALLCHPFVPYLFGVCTAVKPYRVVMHNDLSASNILVADSVTERVSTPDLFVQIVLIDFGKVTTVSNGRKYRLSDIEKTRRYPHLAPEVIDGITRQTKWSDIYAAGGIMQRMVENQPF